MSDAVNISDLGLDDITEDFLREQLIDMGIGLNVDTRQGSLYRDAGEGHLRRVAEGYDFMRAIDKIISLTTCTGDVLIEKMQERGLYKNPPAPTPARYYCTYVGSVPEVGDIVTCSRHIFTVESVSTDNNEIVAVIVSEETGTAMNSLGQGTPVIPEVDVNGLISCTLGAIYEPALDAESDDSARQRLINKVSGPDENGNISQMRTWCESVEGVGKARIIPLWNGPQTVKAVIIGQDGTGATEAVVDAVQEYIDPGISGMGEGQAGIGQFVTCVAAENLPINVTVSVLKTAESSYTAIKEKIEETLTDYFFTLATATYSDDIQVRYARVSGLIIDLDEVIDLDNLTVNGGEDNIDFTVYQVPVLGEVTVDGNI